MSGLKRFVGAKPDVYFIFVNCGGGQLWASSCFVDVSISCCSSVGVSW